jgi:hypothetical protein
MLMDVSEGAGRAETDVTVDNPSSSVSFYMTKIRTARYRDYDRTYWVHRCHVFAPHLIPFQDL